MRKFLLTLFSVLLFVCLGAAVACASNSGDTGNYYTLVFRQTNGVRYECDVPSGWEVKEGTTVDFKVVINDEATGEPIVYAQRGEGDEMEVEVLTENNDNSYSVVMTDNTVIRVGGLMAQGNEYNLFVFENTPGVTFNSRTEGLKSGMMVKMGQTVEFSLTINPQYQGDYKVYANTTELSPDVSGLYSFDMIAPTTIKVEGLVKHIDLTLETGDTRVRYYTGNDDNKSYLESDTAIDMVEGELVEFKVQISVYYDQENFEVLANSQILSRQSDGYYRFAISDDTVIRVSGLVEDVSFLERPNGGSGTERNPFKISRPIDLFQVAMQVNSGWYDDGLFYAGYYSLEADIDMEGEQLYIIGDGSTGISVFAGVFQGNGHTISNYVMDDRWVDQETYTPMLIPNVGLFGYVTPTMTSTPAIYDLHLDNFTITADGSEYPEYDGVSDYSLSIGALAGIAYGAEIVGCSATNGRIEIVAGDYGAYVGGLIGQQISAYSSTNNIQLYAGTISCHADVDVSIAVGTDFGFAAAAGGLVGLLSVGAEHLSSYILNSYTTGNVDGALYAGGIVGYAAAATSIINCYSTGDVTAYSPFVWDSSLGEAMNDYYWAYAGGITGRAGFNTVIYSCFAAGEIWASSASANQYESFAKMSYAAAYIETGDELQDAHAFEASVYNVYDMFQTQITENFIRNALHWDAEDWKIENGMPVINFDSSAKDFTIHFEAVDKNGLGDFGAITDISVESRYWSMAMWYASGDMPEYVDGKNGLRSYAYFLDEDLTQRVFLSFIPTGNVTLYVGYADYTEVEGNYYLGASSGAKLEIYGDGSYVYRNGALRHESTYTWDGENLVLLYGYLGELAELPEDYRDYYLSSLYIFGATIENGKITITGGYVQEVYYTEGITGYDYEGNPIYGMVLAATGEYFNMFTEDAPLEGVIEIEGFKYGSYYNNGTVYQFNGNGTGVQTVGNNSTSFTYTVNGSTITINYLNRTVTGTIDGDGYVNMIDSASVNPYDGFTGTWEREFAMNESYRFDGKASNGDTGTWTYSGYDNIVTSGTYTITDGVLTANNGLFTAKLNEDGFLVIDNGSISNIYYMGGSFAGEWYYTYRVDSNNTVSATITLNGISNEGYGTAQAVYGTGAVYNLTYHAVEERGSYTVYIYQNEYRYAAVSYNSGDNTLTGTIDGGAGSRLTAYDAFRGLWISNNENLPSVQFNGNGFYDLNATSNSNGAGALAVRALVYVNGNSAGSYSINRNTMVGTYTYRNVTYTLKYNEALDVIEVSGSDGSQFNLMHRDMWYGRQLEAEDGTLYTFADGKGNLTEGGTLQVSDGSEYTYYLNEDGSIKLEAPRGTYAGTIAAQDYNGKSVFMLTPVTGAPVVLTIYTSFTGEWIIGGESGKLSIGTIYADNTASGSYQFHGEDEVAVEFNYNFAGNYLTFNYNGTTMYINTLVSAAVTELSIGPDNSTTSSNNSICISADRADSQYGKVYYIYDTVAGADTGSTLVFDGISSSLFGSATAVVYDANGNITSAYVYTIEQTDEGERVQFIGDGYWAYYMTKQKGVPTRDLTENEMFCMRDDDGNYYMITRPDSLEEVTIADADNADVSYTFDGVGGVVRHNADGSVDEFSYVIILTDNVNFLHVLQFTAEDGTVYTATLDQSNESDSSAWTIKLSPADKYMGLVGFDTASQAAYFLFDGAGRVIRLSNIESVVNYTYELVSESNNVATFIFTDENGTQYTATFDMTSANPIDWTVTLTR